MVVVVEDVVVAGAAEVVVVVVDVLGDSEVPDSSDGAEKAVEVVVVVDVALVLLDALVSLVVVGIVAMTAGSDASPAPSTDGEPCAPADCMVVTVTPPVEEVGGTESPFSLPLDEQADANDNTTSVKV